MQVALVTGCAGLLGSHLSHYLVNKGLTVVGVDDLSGGYDDWLPDAPNFHFVKCSLVDTESLTGIFSTREVDVVYHFAAYAAEGLSPFIRRFNYENNVVASANVINCCIQGEAKLVFASSMAVYGSQETPFHEAMDLRPIDPYGNAKAAVERDIQMAYEQFGMRYSIIRPHNIIGRNQNIWDRYRNVLGIFIRRTIAGLPMIIYGTGDQRRAFSDVKFYLEPFYRLRNEFDGETFNLGADDTHSIKDLAFLVAEIATEFGLDPQIEYGEPRHEAFYAFCDHRKAKEKLNFIDKTNIRETARDVFLWALTQPEREVKNIRYEVTRNLYQYWR
jgi:UDP-glucose 4-epimerase